MRKELFWAPPPSPRAPFAPGFCEAGERKSAPLYARFHKKTKPQNSACKAASAALSGLAFHQGVLRPSALHLPLCSGFAVLRSFCKTFVSLLHRAFPRPFFCSRSPSLYFIRPKGASIGVQGAGKTKPPAARAPVRQGKICAVRRLSIDAAAQVLYNQISALSKSRKCGIFKVLCGPLPPRERMGTPYG